MARSEKGKNTPSAPVVVMPEAPSSEPSPPEPETSKAPPQFPPRKGKPVAKDSADSRFWDIMNGIPKEQWGEEGRTYIYLYILEPFCDLKTEGKPGYLTKFFEPVDADYIMRRWGSGKYYLQLKHRKPGKKTDDTLADIVFQIYNPEHPPKLAQKFWKNDNRNDRWLALLPKESPDQQQKNGSSSLSEVAEVLRVASDIRREVKEELQPGEGSNATGQFSELVTAAAKLVEMAKPAAAPAAPAMDPFALLNQIMTIQTNNPMVATLNKQIEVMQSELSKERDNREAALRKELESLKTKLDGGGESELDRLVKMGEKKEQIAKALGLATDAIEHVRSKPMPWWADILKETVTSFVQSPLAGVLAQRMAMPAQPNLGAVPPYPPPINVQPQPAAPQNGQAQPQASNLMAFMEMVSPTMLRYFDAGREGDEFADWMYAGYPVEFAQVQKLQHPLAPGQIGAPVLVALYKVSPYWSKIAAREQAFVKFAEEFCKWTPEADEEDIPEAETESPSESEPEHIDV